MVVIMMGGSVRGTPVDGRAAGEALAPLIRERIVVSYGIGISFLIALILLTRPVRRRRSDCDFDDEGSQNRRMEFVTLQAGEPAQETKAMKTMSFDARAVGPLAISGRGAAAAAHRLQA